MLYTSNASVLVPIVFTSTLAAEFIGTNIPYAKDKLEKAWLLKTTFNCKQCKIVHFTREMKCKFLFCIQSNGKVKTTNK